ncbi:hypothetical protein LSAT2_009079 [Lamellibrachia satsuma]|nr:hypothetical protein LSAT2_009079 [Lamellibrachia satsuma]
MRYWILASVLLAVYQFGSATKRCYICKYPDETNPDVAEACLESPDTLNATNHHICAHDCRVTRSFNESRFCGDYAVSGCKTTGSVEECNTGCPTDLCNKGTGIPIRVQPVVYSGAAYKMVTLFLTVLQVVVSSAVISGVAYNKQTSNIIWALTVNLDNTMTHLAEVGSNRDTHVSQALTFCRMKDLIVHNSGQTNNLGQKGDETANLLERVCEWLRFGMD